MKKFLNKNFLLILILLVALFFRIYKIEELFLYGHDNDLIGWIIKDVVVNKHPRLIGQETSTHGIFIGPLFYYYLIPFYLLFNMDPIGGVYGVILLALFSTWSFYYVFKKIYSKRSGLIAAFVYATNFYIITNDRQVNPTQPIVFVWSLWFFYGLNLLLKGKRFGYLLLGILVGLIWHINVALVLLLPIVLLPLLFSNKKLDWRGIAYGTVLFIIFSIPLFAFEIRHGFIQANALFQSFSGDQGAVVSGFEKFERTLTLVSKNGHALLFPGIYELDPNLSFAVLVIGLFFLVHKKKVSKQLGIILSLWVVSYLAFFSFYSKILSEYYLNGMIIVWLIVLTLIISGFLESKNRNIKKFGLAILFLYFILNAYRFFNQPINRSGYLERKTIVAAIKEDAQLHDYPCISISYITSPGNQLGYRWFFYLESMHVNQPMSEAPPYTIVFPHSKVDRIDRSFGALGLILPDYKRYNKDGILKSCRGENANLVDSMFGYLD